MSDNATCCFLLVFMGFYGFLRHGIQQPTFRHWPLRDLKLLPR